MGSGCHKQIMVCCLRERFSELVGERFLIRTGRAHAMGLIDNDQIPAASQ